MQSKKRVTMLSKLTVVSALMVLAVNAAGAVIYVDVDATGNNNGTSWGDAYTSLASALTAAQPNDEIWVAAGTYYPSERTKPDDPRSATFNLKDSVALYGGFSGTEINRAQRDWEENETILSGDIGAPLVDNDNCYHVVRCSVTARLDGFTVRDGYANALFDTFGGGIKTHPCTFAVDNCLVTHNHAETNGSYAASGAGMIAAAGCIISNTRFVENHSLGANASGGGLTTSCIEEVTITIENCVFLDNSASDRGGGIQSQGGVSLNDCFLSGNYAGQRGGGISSGFGPLTLYRCTLDSNTAGISGTGVYPCGGAVASDSIIDADQCSFVGNQVANGSGGAVFFRGGLIDRCRFYENRADAGAYSTSGYGGAVHCELAISDSQISNCAFLDNYCDYDGAAVLVQPHHNYRDLVMANCTIAGNTADGCSVDLHPFYYDIYPSNFSLDNSIVYANTGGTVRSLPSFSVNHSDIEGGWSGSGSGNIDVDPLFVNTPGPEDLSLDYASPCINAGNNALVPDGIDYDLLGNTRVFDTTVDMGAYEFTPITRNVPSEYASIQAAIDAAQSGDTVLVADGTYTGTGNKDLDFGGKCITLRSQSGATSTIIDCQSSGRGLHFHSGEANTSVVRGFTIKNGSGPGAAICCESGSSPSIIACIMTQNGGYYFAGAVWCNGSNPLISNCLISNNNAEYAGGGVYCISASPTIANCTIAYNSAASGGGVCCYSSSAPTIVNSILWGNTNGQIYESSSTATVTYSDVQGGWTGTGNIDADPMLSADRHLQAGSPCIDAGDNSAVPPEITVDLAGNPRFIDEPSVTDTGNGTPPIVDIGAYEFGLLRVNWRSLRTHGSAGELAISLDPAATGNGSSGATVETRRYGIQKIEVDFNQPVRLVTGTTIEAEDLATSTMYAATSATIVNDSTLVINFDSGVLANEKCYEIELAGKVETDPTGLGIAGDSNCMLRSLTGDVDADGNVDADDIALIHDQIEISTQVTEETARFEVNLSGAINTIDMTLVQSLNGTSTTCP